MFPLVLIAAAIGGLWWYKNRSQTRTAIGSTETKTPAYGGLLHDVSVARAVKQFNEVGGAVNGGFAVYRDGARWKSETFNTPVTYRVGADRNPLATLNYNALVPFLGTDEGLTVESILPNTHGEVSETMTIERLPQGQWKLMSNIDPVSPVFATRDIAFAAAMMKA